MVMPTSKCWYMILLHFKWVHGFWSCQIGRSRQTILMDSIRSNVFHWSILLRCWDLHWKLHLLRWWPFRTMLRRRRCRYSFLNPERNPRNYFVMRTLKKNNGLERKLIMYWGFQRIYLSFRFSKKRASDAFLAYGSSAYSNKNFKSTKWLGFWRIKSI